jgi:flagellar motor switch protein FliG
MRPGPERPHDGPARVRPATRADESAGARRVAVLLVALGSDVGAPLLRGLSEVQIEAVTRQIVRLGDVSDRETAGVLRACFEAVTAGPAVAPAGESRGAGYARDLLGRILGDRKADQVVARAADGRGDDFSFVRRLDPSAVVAYLAGEHPQTVAIALAHTAPETAGQLLAMLSPELQAEVAERLVRMGRTDPEVVAQVAGAMRARLAPAGRSDLRSAGGVGYLVEVLASCDSKTERAVLEALQERDPDLAHDVRERMFTFDDVAALDDRSLHRLLRDVDLADLAIAMRGATPRMQHAFTRNMSRRTADLLRLEAERIGPVRVRAIEEAQHKILSTARRLMEADEIVVARGRQDVYV